MRELKLSKAIPDDEEQSPVLNDLRLSSPRVVQACRLVNTTHVWEEEAGRTDKQQHADIRTYERTDIDPIGKSVGAECPCLQPQTCCYYIGNQSGEESFSQFVFEARSVQ